MHGPIRRSAASELMHGPMIDAHLSYKSGSVLTMLLRHSHNKHFTPIQTLHTTDPILTFWWKKENRAVKVATS